MATREEVKRAIRQGMFNSVPKTFVWFIKELLERDTPKEPAVRMRTVKSTIAPEFDNKVSYYTCSECGTYICSEDADKDDYHFCPKCGSAIKWGA